MAPSPRSPPFISNSLRITDAFCLPTGGLLLTVQDTNKLLGLPRGYWFESQMREHNGGSLDLRFPLEKSFREWYYRDNWQEGLQFYFFQEDPARNLQLKRVARRAMLVRGGPQDAAGPGGSSPSGGDVSHPPALCSRAVHIMVQHADDMHAARCQGAHCGSWGPAWDGPLMVQSVSFCALMCCTRAARGVCSCRSRRRGVLSE